MSSRGRAESLLELRRFAEARDLVVSLLAEEPDDADLHGLHAQALLGLDDGEGALAEGNRVVALDPESEWGHRICSVALRQLGNHAGATVAAAEAVRLAPYRAETHRAFAQAALGVPVRIRDAEAAANRALQLAPHDPANHFTYALVCEQLNEVDRARQAYRETLRLDPTHAAAINNLNLLDNRWSLRKSAHGFASALSFEPDIDVARQNLDALAVRFFRRLYYGALLAFLVGLAAAGAADFRLNAVSVTAGVLGLGSVAAYAVVLLRAVPAGVRHYLRPQLTRNRFLLCTALLTAVMVVTTAVVCFVPGGGSVGIVLLRPIGFANVAMVIWAVSRS